MCITIKYGIIKIFLGAVCIEDEDGKRVLISERNPLEREAMAKTLLISTSAGPDSDNAEFKVKYVHRHLRNGDAMLLNRQPSLHKPSIMSHRFEIFCTILAPQLSSE
jgi:DNA-directed RNA polymerase I subunit RPA1